MCRLVLIQDKVYYFFSKNEWDGLYFSYNYLNNIGKFYKERVKLYCVILLFKGQFLRSFFFDVQIYLVVGDFIYYYIILKKGKKK